VLFANGNLNVSAGSFGTSSVVVFVKDNLTISGNVTVDDGGYVAFIVDGNISIEPSVSLVEGVYISDGTIAVQSNKTDPTDLGTDVQFVGEGIFVGWAGVGLKRDLGEDTDGGGPDQGNNDMPAEKFVYRPDLVLNAPEEFLSTQVRMEERAPRDLYVEGYVTPTPPPVEEVVLGQEMVIQNGMDAVNKWVSVNGSKSRINEAGNNIAKVYEETKNKASVSFYQKYSSSNTKLKVFNTTKYRLSFKVKAPAGGKVEALITKKGSQTATVGTFSPSCVIETASGTWQTQECTFTALQNAEARVTIKYVTTDSESRETYFVDDVSLKAIE
jgi:hypothetical protein